MREKAATLKDIAKKLDVSVTTISKALKNHPDISKERREQILAAVDELNYVPNAMASNLRMRSTRFVGLIVSNNANPYFAEVVSGIEKVLSKEGYFTLMFNNGEDAERELKFVNELRSINVAGVIITPACGNSESVEVLRASKIPFVLLNRYINKDRDNYVVANDYMSGYQGTKRLIERGPRPVYYFNLNTSISAARERLAGYHDALNEAGIDVRKEWIIDNIQSPEVAYNAITDLYKKQGREFSVLCYSDYVALGALKALNELGISVPDEVAVLGIDGISVSKYLTNPLTTMYVDKFKLGAESANLLLALIENNHEGNQKLPEKHIVIDSKLIIGKTS